MRRSTREIIGGLAVIIICVLIYIGLRILIARTAEDSGHDISEAERAAVEAFEADRQKDSARQQAHWDSLHASWASDKASRQLAREQREQAYADSQVVWAARREHWAAEKAERQDAAARRQAHYDSVRATYPKKLPTGSFVEANAADTALLKQIPGIGSAYARKILAYRDQLGGFVSAKQIEEIDGLPYGISTWFRVSASANVKQININRADFKTIVHHPYMSYDQTKYVVNLRNKIGKLRGWEDLQGSGLFTDSDIARLKPYFTF